MFTNKTQYLTHFFKIYQMMKVIVIENLYPKLKINVNIRCIQNISFVNAPWIQKNVMMYPLMNVLLYLMYLIWKHITLQNITLYNL
jgi:hypothetical protein